MVKKHIKLLEEALDPLMFDVKDKDRKETVDSGFLAFMVSVFLFIISIVFSWYGLTKTAYAIFAGGLVYELYFILNLYELSKFRVKSFKNVHLKHLAHFLTKVIYGLLFLTIIVFLFINKPIDSGEPRIYLIFALIIVTFPIIFWSKLFRKIKNKKLIYSFLFLIFFFPTISLAQSLGDVQGTLDTVDRGIDTARDAIGIIGQVKEGFNNVLGFFSGIGNTFTETFNLGAGTSSLVSIVILLAIIFFLLKFLRLIIKWAIVFLSIWIVLQIFGLI